MEQAHISVPFTFPLLVKFLTLVLVLSQVYLALVVDILTKKSRVCSKSSTTNCRISSY